MIQRLIQRLIQPRLPAGLLRAVLAGPPDCRRAWSLAMLPFLGLPPVVASAILSFSPRKTGEGSASANGDWA
jgi:hypothetical protein